MFATDCYMQPVLKCNYITNNTEIIKKTKIIYWTTTIIIFLIEGILPHTQKAAESKIHLGYPVYFGIMLNTFKIVGVLALIIPAIKGRFKEWVYAGFGINFISASISWWSVDGFTLQSVLPLVFLGILITSYINYHKIQSQLIQ